VPKAFSAFLMSRPLFRHFFAVAASLALLAPGSVLAQSVWTGANGSNWNDVGNWTGGIPGAGTVLQFSGTPVNQPTNNDIVGLVSGAINFTNSAAGAPVFTLNGNAITLGGNITTTASTTTIITDTINLNLILDANRTITTNSFHALAINGEISGAFSLTKAGPQVLTLTNAASSFSGTLAITAGTVTARSLAASGVNSSIGSGSLITIGSGTTTAGTLTYNGTATGSTTVDRGITLAATTTGAATINNDGAGPLVFNGTFANSQTSGAKTFTLGGTNTGANEFQSNIVNGSGGTLAVTKANAGTWILSGNNSYTGINTVTAGTLQVNRATNGLGDSTAANTINLNGGTLSLRNDGTGNDGTIIYGSTSNAAGYNLQLSATSTINVSNLTANTGNTIQLGALTQATASIRTLNVTGDNGYKLTLASLGLNPGTGQTTTLNPTTASIVITGNVTNPMSGFTASNFNTLVLGGTSTDNRINGIISDAVGGSVAAGGTTRVTKSGSGTWTLSGANTYTGATTIDAGTLKLGASEIITTNLILNAGTFDLAGFNETITSLDLGRSTTDATTAGQTASIITSAGAGTLTLGAGITYRAGSAGFENGQTTISANLATGNAARNFSVGNGAATDDLVISGALSGSGTITKQGAGTLVLSGANTHTGQLSIQQGTVKLGASGVLPDANAIQMGVNASTTGTTIDLNGFSETVGNLAIGGAGGTNNPSAAGLVHSIVNTGTAGAVLTLNGSFAYNTGTTNQNAQAVISADLNTGTSSRNLTVGDSTHASAATVDLLISGSIVGANGFNKAGAGTLALSAANTFTGVTRPGTGILMLQNNLALQNSPVNLETASTGTISLDTGITTPTFGGLRGERDLSTVITSGYSSVTQITLNPGIGSTSTYSGVIADGAAGMNVAKTGVGTQVLTGTNTYTGTTTVSAGSLQVGNAGTGTTGTGAVSVITGGTMLGTGIVRGASFTAASGSTIHAGDSTGAGSFGTLTFTPASGSGSFDFQSGSSTVLGLNPGGAGDLLNFDGLSAGTLNFNGNLSVLATGYIPSSIEVFNLLDWTNLSTVNFHSRFNAGSYAGFLLGNGDDNLGFDLPDISSSGFAWDISNFTTLGQIAVVVVPEPSRAVLLMLGLLGVWGRRRR